MLLFWGSFFWNNDPKSREYDDARWLLLLGKKSLEP
jgi:hypothetical protein